MTRDTPLALEVFGTDGVRPRGGLLENRTLEAAAGEGGVRVAAIVPTGRSQRLGPPAQGGRAAA